MSSCIIIERTVNEILSIRKMYKIRPKYIYLQIWFCLGENNMQSPYTGTLLSSNLYPCHSDHYSDLSSYKYLSLGCLAKNVT